MANERRVGDGLGLAANQEFFRRHVLDAHLAAGLDALDGHVIEHHGRLRLDVLQLRLYLLRRVRLRRLARRRLRLLRLLRCLLQLLRQLLDGLLALLGVLLVGICALRGNLDFRVIHQHGQIDRRLPAVFLFRFLVARVPPDFEHPALLQQGVLHPRVGD